MAYTFTAESAANMTYIYELADWPNLTRDDGTLAQPLAAT